MAPSFPVLSSATNGVAEFGGRRRFMKETEFSFDHD